MGEERIKSPDECSDQVSSGNSGNTETGQPFIPQVHFPLKFSCISLDFNSNKHFPGTVIQQINSI